MCKPLLNALRFRFDMVCWILHNFQYRGHTDQTEYLYRYVFLMISIDPAVCTLLVVITALQQIREGDSEEGEIHGDPLGCTAERRFSVFQSQEDWGHVD